MRELTAVYKHLFEEFKLDVISAECWTATPLMFDGLAPCAAYGLLTDMGYLMSCESDIHAAMTMALLKCATPGEGKPLFGEFTAACIDRENGGRCVVLPRRCHTTEGPLTHGTYIWGEFDDLDKVESKLMDGHYIHHFVEMEGDYTREIAEFCKYFPNLHLDSVDNRQQKARSSAYLP